MTTLFSTTMTANQTPVIPRVRVALVALWLTQIALAGMFILAGGLKLAGVPVMVALFDAIGIGQWFRYVTGSIEVVSAVRSEEHTSELQSRGHLVCRHLLEKNTTR